ncbi:MAG: HEPN domain-containing protein [Cyclobacteriaceae bacterium]|nr:HEPN domain-containing protein [Cyclobacteriaceae bacterium]
MTIIKKDLVNYRLERARETLQDATLLAEKERWNSAINRLYYSAYYAIIALLLNENHKSTTHSGVKIKFSEHFIKTGDFPAEFGKIYSQLFTWRQKGDYADFFDFTEEKVKPYFVPVKKLIELIEQRIKQI